MTLRGVVRIPKPPRRCDTGCCDVTSANSSSMCIESESQSRTSHSSFQDRQKSLCTWCEHISVLSSKSFTFVFPFLFLIGSSSCFFCVHVYWCFFFSCSFRLFFSFLLLLSFCFFNAETWTLTRDCRRLDCKYMFCRQLHTHMIIVNAVACRESYFCHIVHSLIRVVAVHSITCCGGTVYCVAVIGCAELVRYLIWYSMAEQILQQALQRIARERNDTGKISCPSGAAKITTTLASVQNDVS